MLLKKLNISRIIIGLFLIMLTCGLPVSGADIVSATPETTPFITIDPIGNHTIGDVFFINGTTNLPISGNLTMDIIDSGWAGRTHFGPDTPPIGSEVAIPYIKIVTNSGGTNRWSINVTNSVNELAASNYFVAVWSETNTSCARLGCPGKPSLAGTTAYFILYPENSTGISNYSIAQTPIQSSLTKTQHPLTPGSLPPPTQSSLPLSSMPLALLAAILIMKIIRLNERD